MSSVAQALGLSDAEVIQIITATLNRDIIEIITYGLYTMVFVSTMHHIGARSGTNKWPSQRIALTIIICVIWALATIHMGIVWNSLVSTFVTHGQSQNSVLGYIMIYGDENWSKKRLILNVFANMTIALNAILAELINVWRCWELYNRNYLIAGLPLLCLLCGFCGSEIFAVLGDLTLDLRFRGPRDVLCELTVETVQYQINWPIVYYSITASTNILTTFLIIFRILSIGGLRSARTYRGLLEILIESAFLYSATYILYIPYWSYALAPTMIIGRVMAGEARPNDSWTNSSLSPMGSTMRNLTESIRFSSFHPARTQNTVMILDSTSQVEDATASLTEEENLAAGSEGVAGYAGESEIQIEKREGVEVV
ncbi:hypothetical protein BDZ89DRAFT_1241956 [Hymenopellis radicata]|nr:hypothetical protein BDZ89DRAFT_1241956 [Hymenopellis radicata]